MKVHLRLKVHFQFYIGIILTMQSPQRMLTSRVARTDILQLGQIYFLVLLFFGVVGGVPAPLGEPRPGARAALPSVLPMRISSQPSSTMNSISASVGEVTDQPTRES